MTDGCTTDIYVVMRGDRRDGCTTDIYVLTDDINVVMRGDRWVYDRHLCGDEG